MIQAGKFQDLLPKQLKNLYLQRYAWPGPIITEKPKPNTKIIVVIPCYNEPDILKSLESIFNCETPDCAVEVITVVNHAESEKIDIKNFNSNTFDSIKKWMKSHSKKELSFYAIKGFDLPEKQAGVGLARKIGMDEAVRRFEYLHERKGVLVCYDADCLCSPNYLKEIYQFYLTTPETNAAIVYYEHLLEGEFDDVVYDGIVNYELHLRYYKNALQLARFPYCFHTIGSCITVTSEAYQKQGGMNKRKAGEDFYFLQKIFPLGNIYEINSTAVFPSPRLSDRVPFGTGKAINDFIKTKKTNYYTYNPKTFLDFGLFIEKVPSLYKEKDSESIIDKLPLSIHDYLSDIGFLDHVSKIKKNCNTDKQFVRSFYNWFNGFAALKFVHFARDNYYQDIEIFDAVNWILKELTEHQLPVLNKRKALEYMRSLDRLQ